MKKVSSVTIPASVWQKTAKTIGLPGRNRVDPRVWNHLPIFQEGFILLEQLLQFDINILSVFLLVTMLIIIRIKGDRLSYSNGLFRSIIYLTGLGLVLEAVSWISDTYSGLTATVVNYTSNWLLVLVGPVLIGFWISYLDYKILLNPKRIRKLCHYQYATFLTLILLIVNVFVPLYFSITGDNEYAAGPLSWLNPLIMGLHLVYSVFLTVRHRDKTNIGVIRGVTAFFILPAFGTLLQLIHVQFLFTWPMLALAVVVVYVFLETTSGTLDRLTNLYSRAKFDEYLRYLKENADPFCLLMLDLDDFKTVNDTKGHQTGDIVLAEFSRMLKAVFHDQPMVARLGGDEFIVVMHANGPEKAIRNIEELRRMIAAAKGVPALRKLKFSYGYLENDPEASIDELLTSVDHRMYADKTRNRMAGEAGSETGKVW